MFTEQQKSMLAGDLDTANVKVRTGAKNAQLAYVEGWHVIAEANRIFGFDGWSSETVEIRPTFEGKLEKGGFTVAYVAKCRVTVYAGDRVLIREGSGFGSGTDYGNPGAAHEKAIKEAETDARKRALMQFGNKFGLALYDKERRNVSDGADEEHDPETGELPPKQPEKKNPVDQYWPNGEAAAGGSGGSDDDAGADEPPLKTTEQTSRQVSDKIIALLKVTDLKKHVTDKIDATLKATASMMLEQDRADVRKALELLLIVNVNFVDVGPELDEYRRRRNLIWPWLDQEHRQEVNNAEKENASRLKKTPQQHARDRRQNTH